MRHLRTIPVAVALGALALSGCSSDASPSASSSGAPSGSASSSATPSGAPTDAPTGTPTGTPTGSDTDTPSGSASTSASPYASGSPSDLPTVRLQATNYHVAILTSSVAKTAEERAAVAAWMTFWQAVTDSGYLMREDPDLAGVSTPAERARILKYLGDQKKKGYRIVGWAQDHVLGVTVSGDRARLHDCTKNFTFSVDEEGTPATLPDHYYDVRGTLVKRDGRWLVDSAPSDVRSKSCL